MIQWSGLRGKDGVWGGDLVDTATPFAGRDKVVHFVLGALVWLELVAIGVAAVPALGIVTALALANEVVEGIRYKKYGWTRSLSDIPDGTDVLVTVAGGAVAWGLRWAGTALM